MEETQKLSPIDDKPFKLVAAANTDIGKQSDHNEDTIFCQVSAGETAALLIVADGMGGHLAGEQASELVATTVARAMNRWLGREQLPHSARLMEEIEQALYTAVKQANQTVYDYAQEHLGYGAQMGSTVACCFIHKTVAYIANVGDSRVYLYRQGQLHRITEDHSLVERLVQEGIITDSARYQHPARNVVTRAIGPSLDVAVDLFTCKLEIGDYLLLCSDGLWEMVRGHESIIPHLQSSQDLPTIGQSLIQAANDAGGEDNISVVLAQLLPVNGQ